MSQFALGRAVDQQKQRAFHLIQHTSAVLDLANALQPKSENR